MKKTIAAMMALVLAALSATAVFADGNTVLTTVIPAASYELVIPENQSIPYGQRETLIGPVTVVNSQHFTDGKYVTAEVSCSPLKSDEGEEIEYFIRSIKKDSGTSAPMNGKTIIFDNDGEGGVNEYGYMLDPSDGFHYQVDNIGVYISEEKWEAAKPGTYTSTVTFTSKVVSPQ